MRNLTKTLAVVSLLAPASAQPLGIGDLKLHSALNQKLNAEINLLLSAGESPSDIQVRMAPPEKFDEAGVPWSFFLSKIKFDTVVKPNGAVVVKLSSNEALQEPFLDFLLEVTWTKGNMYREFTVLVDPPAAYEQPVVPVVDQAEPSQRVQQPTAPTPKPAEKVPSAVSEGIQVDSYGPTTRSDTLWQIAEQVKPSEDISTEQMMMAIYEANPRAFYKDNVNALMSGQVLDIPDKETIVKLSKQQAANLFSQQVNAWNAAAKPAASEKPTEPAAEDVVSSQLELEAPVETSVEGKAVVSPEQEQVTKEAVAVEELAAEEAEALAAESGDDKEVRERLEKLEKQLEMMQKLLALKDEQLAALQNKQLLEQEQQPPQTPIQAGEGVEATQPEKPGVVKPKPKPAPKQKIKPAPVEPEGGLFEDSYYLAIGGVAVVLLGGLGWLWWRQRRPEEHGGGIDESMFASSSEIRMPDSEESTMVSTISSDESPAYDVGTVGESSFLSEFTPSDFDAFDSDMNEVDPISEADVYLAYGRYQQAEELMRQAIADEPERNDCKLKLLEIFYANENKDAFEDYVGELAEEGKRNDQAFWSKVLEMGNEIIPGSAILTASESFEDEIQEEETKRNVEQKGTDETGPKEGEEDDFDLTSFDQDFADEDELIKGVDEEESDNDSLDFDLSAFEEPETAEEKPAQEEDIESVEFDLSAFADEEAEQSKTEAGTEEEFETFDFSSEIEQEGNKEDSELKLGEEADEDLESFDFSTIEGSVEKQEAAEAEKLSDSDDEFDFNFDLEDESMSESGVSDLTDMDEFETKIDLAKAYIDMGDADAAKSIAEEVMEKGNDQQKQTAQSLLDQLK